MELPRTVDALAADISNSTFICLRRESENMRKGSGYSLQAAYYVEVICISSKLRYWAELFCLFTQYGILDGKLQPINS